MKRRALYAGCALAVLVLATSGIARRDAQDAEITAQHVRQATERRTDLRPCDGLWIRHSGARFRGSPQCAPSADLTELRPLPPHILTMPVVGLERTKR